MKKILLVCGTGASSGFMASNARKSAKAQGIKLDFIARSDSVIDDYIDEVSLIMVGPHLSYLIDDLRDDYADSNTPIELIEEEIYGTLNGEGLVSQALEILERTE